MLNAHVLRQKEKTYTKNSSCGRPEKKVIATAFSNGRRHDFRLFKESTTRINPKTKVITDSGYQGLQKLHGKSEVPKKKRKKQLLSKEDKKQNRALAK